MVGGTRLQILPLYRRLVAVASVLGGPLLDCLDGEGLLVPRDRGHNVLAKTREWNTMTDRVLVPIDGSEQSWNALEYALREGPDDEIVVLHVINPVEGVYATDAMGGDYWEGWYDEADARAERLFEEARDLAAERDVAIETAKETGQPTRAIVAYADEHGVDHIVIGSHGRSGVSRILLGSVAEVVVRRADVPVTVIR